MYHLYQFVVKKVVVEYQKPNFQSIKNKIDNFTFHLFLEYFLLLIATDKINQEFTNFKHWSY
jgi:hypothetical protein